VLFGFQSEIEVPIIRRLFGRQQCCEPLVRLVHPKAPDLAFRHVPYLLHNVRIFDEIELLVEVRHSVCLPTGAGRAPAHGMADGEAQANLGNQPTWHRLVF
jgi:hypothetical protein